MRLLHSSYYRPRSLLASFSHCERPCKGLLQRTVRLPDGVAFYLRSFFVLLFFSALGGALGFSSDLKPGSHFMEYVWKVASGLSNVLEQMLLYLGGYLVLTTIILASLKIKDDK